MATQADVSKTNLLYYFGSKEELYVNVLRQLLEVWLQPLQAFSVEQDPVEAIRDYLRVKLELSVTIPPNRGCSAWRSCRAHRCCWVSCSSRCTTVENKVAVIGLDRRRQARARRAASPDLLAVGDHPALRRFSRAGRGGGGQDAG